MGAIELVWDWTGIPNAVTGAFRTFVQIGRTFELWAMDLKFFMVVITFFMILAGIIIIPLWLYPRVMRIKVLFFKFFEGVGGSNNRLS